jgi:acyl transferase domain-containing protein
MILTLKHRKVPTLLHFENINPLCALEGSAFFVNKTELNWAPDEGRTRMAALNSFGHSGTNVHLVLREYRGASEGKKRARTGPALVLLSAKTEERLKTAVRNLSVFLEGNPATDLHELAYTLQVGRESMPERVAWVVADMAELREKLRMFVEDGAAGSKCWRGSVDEDIPAARRVGADAESRSQIRKSLAGRTLDKLGDFWVRGADIDWSLMYGAEKPRRISLPSYPFVRDAYWIPAAEARQPQHTSGKAVLHPLVHENCSSFSGTRFRSRFNGEEFFFRDHQVQGVKVLPGVAYHEMARAAVEQALKLDSLLDQFPFFQGSDILPKPVLIVFPIIDQRFLGGLNDGIQIVM